MGDEKEEALLFTYSHKSTHMTSYLSTSISLQNTCKEVAMPLKQQQKPDLLESLTDQSVDTYQSRHESLSLCPVNPYYSSSVNISQYDPAIVAGSASGTSSPGGESRFSDLPPRLPRSGFTLFGRAWYLGSEDMFLPAICSVITDVVVLAVAAAALILFRHRQSVNDACTGNDYAYFALLVWLEVVLWSVSVLLDLAIALTALRSRMFEPNVTMVKLMYIRIGFSVLSFPLAIICTYSFARLDSGCLSAATGDIFAETRLLLALLVLQWIVFALSCCFTCCSFRLASGRGRTLDVATWQRRIGTLACCYRDERAATVYESLAETFAVLFRNDAGAHVVPSDVAVGLLLVQGAQRNNIAEGYQFLVADTEQRWASASAFAADSNSNPDARAAAAAMLGPSPHAALLPLPLRVAPPVPTEPLGHAPLRDPLPWSSHPPHPPHATSTPMPTPACACADPSLPLHATATANANARASVTLPALATPTASARAAFACNCLHATHTSSPAHLATLAVPAHDASFGDSASLLLPLPLPQRASPCTSAAGPSDRPSICDRKCGVECNVECGVQADAHTHADNVEGPAQQLHTSRPASPSTSHRTNTGNNSISVGAGGDESQPTHAPHPNPRLPRTTPMLTARGHAQWMVTEALAYRQPPLQAHDLRLLREAKHYAPFAQGAYGWPLLCWDHCARAVCCCEAIPCGCGRPDGCGWGHRYSSGVVRHGGCADGLCCMASAKAFLTHTQLQPADVLRANTSARYGEVCYIVARDRATGAVVVSVRGTMSVADTVTDLDATPALLPGAGRHYTHRGMLLCARWLLRELGYHEDGARDEHAEWALWRMLDVERARLVLTGHSLGAGVATLLALLLEPLHADLRCYAFAPPPALDPVTAARARSCVATFVYKHDMICRLSVAAVFRLRQQMVNAFKICVDSKFDILRHTRAQRFRELFAADAPHWDLAEGFHNHTQPHTLPLTVSATETVNTASVRVGSRSVGNCDAVEGSVGGQQPARREILTGVMASVGGRRPNPAESVTSPVAAAPHVRETSQTQRAQGSGPGDAVHLAHPAVSTATAANYICDRYARDCASLLPAVPPTFATTMATMARPSAVPPVRDAAAAVAVTEAVRAVRHEAIKTRTHSRTRSRSQSKPRRETQQLAAALSTDAPSGDECTWDEDDTLHAEPMGIDDGDPSREAVVDAATRLAASHGRENVALVELHLPGRIYHMLPAEPKRSGFCRQRRKLLVYPADPHTFDELFVSGSMFSDHMPVKYTLQNLDIDAIECASSVEYIL